MVDTRTRDEWVQAAQGFGAAMLSLLDRLDANHGRILETLQRVEAARERAIHAADRKAFKARVGYYRAVTEIVQKCGCQAVIEHWREAARTDGTTPKRLRDFECLVRACASGMTLSEYLEFDSPRAWFARQTGGSNGVQGE